MTFEQQVVDAKRRVAKIAREEERRTIAAARKEP